MKIKEKSEIFFFRKSGNPWLNLFLVFGDWLIVRIIIIMINLHV